MKVFVLILLSLLLASCSPTRQRVVVVNVAADNLAQVDTTAVTTDCAQQVRKQEKKKEFWRCVAVAFGIVILLQFYVSPD